MCEFFSVLVDDNVNLYYHDADIRKKILSGESDLRADSHASIAKYHFGSCRKEDEYWKYEYNPLTHRLSYDGLGTGPSESFNSKVLTKIQEIDFSKVIPGFVLHDIIHPFKDVKYDKDISKDVLELVEQWDSVWASVGASVRASVGASVWDSVWASVWDSVWDSVGDSVGDSVWDSVWDSVGDSVGDSVWDSVGDSVRAYTSSFFILEKWKYIEHTPWENPYQPLIDLWNMGIVPAYANGTWYLVSYKGVIWEGKLK